MIASLELRDIKKSQTQNFMNRKGLDLRHQLRGSCFVKSKALSLSLVLYLSSFLSLLPSFSVFLHVYVRQKEREREIASIWKISVVLWHPHIERETNKHVYKYHHFSRNKLLWICYKVKVSSTCHSLHGPTLPFSGVYMYHLLCDITSRRDLKEIIMRI